MSKHGILALALLATCLVAPAAGHAQGNPSTDEIIKSLTPTGNSSPTRGIHVGPAAVAPGRPAPVEAESRPAVSLTVLFATGSAQLTPQAMQVLDNLGQALSNASLVNYRFRIEGHTDTVGSNEYNQDLSQRRAEAVVQYLAGRFHLDPARVQAVGFGKEGLLVPTPDQTPEPRNRRVQVVNLGS
jgi:outer membrane protein OmpA-like peptidoglycan-associated protein